MLAEFILKAALELFSVCCALSYYKTFFEWSKNHIKNGALVCLYCLWQIASFTVLSGLSDGSRVILGIVFTILLCCCFADAFVKRVIFAALYMVIWALVEMLTMTFLWIGEIEGAELELWGSAISKLLLFLLIKALQKFFRHESISALSWKENVLMLLFPICSMLLSHYLFLLSGGAKTGGFFGFSDFLCSDPVYQYHDICHVH